MLDLRQNGIEPDRAQHMNNMLPSDSANRIVWSPTASSQSMFNIETLITKPSVQLWQCYRGVLEDTM